MAVTKPRAWVVVPNQGATTPYSSMIKPGPEVEKLAQVFELVAVDEARLAHALTQWRERRDALFAERNASQ